MMLVEDDGVVEQLPADATDPPLGDAVLPRAAEGRPRRLDAERFHRRDDVFREDRVAIEDYVTWRSSEWKGLAELLDDPGCRGMGGDVAMEDTAATVANREPDVQHTECHCRYGEEVHRGDRIPMVAQEHEPAMDDVGGRRPTRQVARDGALGDLAPEHAELAVDARRSACRILLRHPSDQVSDTPVCQWPPGSSTTAGQPSPVATKPGTVPADDRLWFHEHQDLGPPRPEPAQCDPEPAVGDGDAWAAATAGEGGQLLTQGEVLER